MFVNRRLRTEIYRVFFFLSGSALAVSSGASPVGRNSVGHENVRVINLNATFRIFDSGAGGVDCFEAHVPPGTLKLDVAVPGESAAEPRLVFRGQVGATTREREVNFFYINRSATSTLLDIGASGTYSFCVATQDPLLRLAEYKLTSAFEVGRGLKNGDPDEDDPDPDSLAFGCGLKNGDPDEDDPDPDSLAFGGDLKNGDPDEDDPDPDSLSFRYGAGPVDAELEPLDRRLSEVLAKMCRSGEVDDHGDTITCATALNPGRAVSGEIWNDWGDDQDFFAFRLPELQTVEIATIGGTDTFGSLYDRFGHQLAVDDDEGAGGNFRIVKTLAAGWYFARVEGHDRSEGAYNITVDVLSR